MDIPPCGRRQKPGWPVVPPSAPGPQALPQGAGNLRSPIKEARSIDERPAIVDGRSSSVIGRRTRCWTSKAQVHWSPWWSAKPALSGQAGREQTGWGGAGCDSRDVNALHRAGAYHLQRQRRRVCRTQAIEEALGAEDLLCAPLLFVGRGLNGEQQWAVEAVYPKGNRPERGHGRGCQESGAVKLNLRPRKCLRFRQPVKGIPKSTVRQHSMRRVSLTSS